MSAHMIAALAASVSLASLAQAQSGGTCNIVIDSYGSLNAVRLPSGGYTSYIGSGVTAHCAGESNRLVADSAEHYEDRGVLYLIGNVHYMEPRANVDAARMTYYQGDERLNAEGSVLATFSNGTTMRGPVADYYRVTPARPRERLVATGRPQMTLIERDSAGRAGPPVIVLADRITLDGDSLVYAGGRVDITRTDIVANSDSAFLDGTREIVRLLRSPKVTGRGARPFTLEGGVIEAFSRARRLERVLATPEAHATSTDMEMFADSIDLRIADDLLQRAFAWGPSRARATSPERDILADSLDIILPGQRLDEVRAVGDALATSLPDTADVISSERDWLRGDTIVALFESPAAGDTAQRTMARELVATGSARSFQQLPSQGATRTDPNLNYVRGDRIVVALRAGEVETVTVTGNASGVYLERGESAPPPGTAGRVVPPASAPPPPPPPRR